MKINLAHLDPRRGARAMTLIEMMTSLLLFGFLVTGLISVNLFGLKQDELVNSKLGANDMARLNFDLLLDEIRSCKNIQIGKGSYTNFTPVTNGLQIGDTLQIIPSTNTGVYVWYWFDTNNMILCRAATNGVAGTFSTNLVADSLTNRVSTWMTNALCFTAMDCSNNILTQDPTNYNYNYSIAVNLQFAQYQYPLTLVGSNYLFDYYQLMFQATRRDP